MDPRHPEQAISRMRELMKQYDRIEADMAKATTSAQLAQLEREGGLVVQEICLVAPRIHEAMIQTSRQRRHDLAHGVVDLGIRTKYEQPFEPQDTLVELGNGLVKGAIGLEEKPVENYVDIIGEENIGGESKSMKKNVEAGRKTKKEITRKKKTTKKADK